MARQKKNGRGRKRKTTDKGDEAEMRKGNSEPREFDLKSDDFHFHFKNALGCKARMATAKSAYDSCLAAAKKVSPRLFNSIKLGLSLQGKDMNDIKMHLEEYGFVLKETDRPLQLTIHDTLLGDVVDQARARGEKVGAAGMPMANPYPDGSDLALRYAEGWSAGQSQMSLLSSGVGHNSQAQAAEYFCTGVGHSPD